MEPTLKEGSKNVRTGNLMKDVSCKVKKAESEILVQIDNKLDLLLEKQKETEEKE